MKSVNFNRPSFPNEQRAILSNIRKQNEELFENGFFSML